MTIATMNHEMMTQTKHLSSILFIVAIFHSVISANAFRSTFSSHSSSSGAVARRTSISYAPKTNNDNDDHHRTCREKQESNLGLPSPPPSCPQRRSLLSSATSAVTGTFTASLLPTTSQRPSCICCRCRLYQNNRIMLPPAANALVEMAPPSPNLVQSYDLPRNSGVDSFFSYSMSVGMEGYETKARPYKSQLFKAMFDSLATDRAQGCDDVNDLPVVLEVGMGTFPNAPYYAQAMKDSALTGLDIIGVDPNDSMIDYAKDSAENSGLLSLSRTTSLRNVHGVAEALPFADGSIDAVVATLTLCSVTNPEQALSEICRVLKPKTGQFLFWEHVLSEDDTRLALQQKILSPIQTLVADGCRLDRRTGVNIQNAGFGGGVEMTYMNLDGSDVISPTVFGIATG